MLDDLYNLTRDSTIAELRSEFSVRYRAKVLEAPIVVNSVIESPVNCPWRYLT